MKACNQIQVAMNLLGFAEALVLAEHSGMEISTVCDVLRSGYAQSRVSDVRGPLVIRDEYAPGFRARLHYKDLAIAQETGRVMGCALPGTALVQELFGAAVANGLGDLDHSVILKVIRLLAGQKDQLQ